MGAKAAIKHYARLKRALTGGTAPARLSRWGAAF